MEVQTGNVEHGSGFTGLTSLAPPSPSECLAFLVALPRRDSCQGSMLVYILVFVLAGTSQSR